MKILFRNDAFIAVDKPAGMLSVPGRDPKDPRPVLGRLLEKDLGQDLFPVHRLDAEVSGLILYALDPEPHRQANQEFENRRVKKTYQAYSSGGEFSVDHRYEWKAKILRGKKRAYESPVGKWAVTEALCQGQGPGTIHEWRLFPQTGRSHQLRWELFRHGSPILGDQLYGSTEAFAPGIALRSLSLEFTNEFARQFGLPPLLEGPSWTSPSPVV